MLQHQEVDDINHKYSNSIIFYDDEPVLCSEGMVHRFDGDNKGVAALNFVQVGTDKIAPPKLVRASDPKLSDGPYRLGYMNNIRTVSSDGDAINVVCYITRVPVRRWKWGINQENLHFQGQAMNFRVACRIPEFKQMLKGEYPKFPKAIKMLDEETRAVAYHRHWAVLLAKTGNIDLHFRGQLVGTGADAKTLQLGPKFEFLEDYFKLSRE